MENQKEDEKLVRITINIPAYKKEMIMKVVEKSSYNNVSEFVRAGIEIMASFELFIPIMDISSGTFFPILWRACNPIIAT